VGRPWRDRPDLIRELGNVLADNAIEEREVDKAGARRNGWQGHTIAIMAARGGGPLWQLASGVVLLCSLA